VKIVINLKVGKKVGKATQCGSLCRVGDMG